MKWTMGRSSNFCCRTCRRNYYLGYGCYSTWLDHRAKTIEEYDSLPSKHKRLRKNINLRLCLQQHQGHDFFCWSADWYSEVGDDLIWDWDGKVACKGFSTFRQVSIEEAATFKR